MRVLVVSLPGCRPSTPTWAVVDLSSRLAAIGVEVEVIDANLDFFVTELLSSEGCERSLARLVERPGTAAPSRAWQTLARRVADVPRTLRSGRFYDPVAFTETMATAREALRLHSAAHEGWSFRWNGIGGPDDPDEGRTERPSPLPRFLAGTLLPAMMERDPTVVVLCVGPGQAVGGRGLVACLAEVSWRPRLCVMGDRSSVEGLGGSVDVVAADADGVIRGLFGGTPPRHGSSRDPWAMARYLAPLRVVPVSARDTAVRPVGREPDVAPAARIAPRAVTLRIDEADVDPKRLADRGVAVVHWSLDGCVSSSATSRLLDVSRAGIWNDVVVSPDPQTAGSLVAFAERHPNVVHSWRAHGHDGPSWSVDAVPSVAAASIDPLRGAPFSRAIGDPAYLLLHVVQRGVRRLARVRVEDGHTVEVGRALEFHYRPPAEVATGVLKDLLRMVETGGAVGAEGQWLRRNLENAYLIGYVLERGVIVAVSSLKHPRLEYLDTVSRRVGIDLTGYLERGYTSVRPEYRGLGIGTELLAGLTSRARGRRLFSIIAEENLATKTIARRNDTVQVASFYSERLATRVGLWMPVGQVDPGAHARTGITAPRRGRPAPRTSPARP